MKKIVSIMASIFMALALIGGSAFLLHDAEKTSVVQEEDSSSSNAIPNYSNYWSGFCEYGSTISGRDTNGSKAVVHIRTAEHLARFAYWVNNNYTNPDSQLYSQADVYLDTNIDLSGHYWEPIGWKRPFKGTFNGQGYTISNIYIKKDSSNWNTAKYGVLDTDNKSESKRANNYFYGLFGQTENATIQNLNVSGYYHFGSPGSPNSPEYIWEDTGINHQQFVNHIGGIVAKATNTTIENCENAGLEIHIDRTSGSYDTFMSYLNVGGIAGYAKNSTIQSCQNASGKIHFYADQQNLKEYKGIKYWYYNDDKNHTLKQTTSTHKKTPLRKYRVGGVVGCSDDTQIIEDIFTSEIHVWYMNNIHSLHVGGIVGLQYYNHLYDCISNGSIAIEGNIAFTNFAKDEVRGAIGGIVGYINTYASEIYRCHNYTSISQTCTGSPKFHIGGVLGCGGGKDSLFSDINNDKVQVINCSNFASISNGWQDSNADQKPNDAAGTAGIVGTSGYAHTKINYCVNYGYINGTSGGFTGGVLGNTQRNITLTNCINYGSISWTANGNKCGGIAGQAGNEYQSGWFKQHPSIVGNCVSFSSGMFGGFVSVLNSDNDAFSCYDKSSASMSRQEVIDFFNNSSNWSNGWKLYSYYDNPAMGAWTIIKGLISGDLGSIVTSGGEMLYIDEMTGVWTYHPNYGDDNNALNDRFYISSVNDSSIVYDYDKSNSYTKNAIMPLSATSKTIVQYYVFEIHKSSYETLFKQDDSNVGTSQRYKNSYVDNDPNYGGDFPYYDQIVTLRGVNAANKNIFRFNTSNYEIKTGDITSTQTGKGTISTSYDNSTGNINATVQSFSRRMGTIKVVLSPKTSKIDIYQKDESGNTVTGGSVYLNGSSAKLSSMSFWACNYVYSGSASYSLKVIPTSNYAVKSIQFGSTIKYNTNLTSSDSSTKNSAIASYTASSAVKKARSFSSVTITYAPLYQDIYIYYKLPGESTYKNLLSKDSADTNKGGSISSYQNATMYINPSYLRFRYDGTIQLSSCPGYYISSISAYHTLDSAKHGINCDYQINQRSGQVEACAAIINQGAISWLYNESLNKDSLQNFIQKNFFSFDQYRWKVDKIYVDFAYAIFDASVSKLSNPSIENELVSVKCILGGDISLYVDADEDGKEDYDEWSEFAPDPEGYSLPKGTEITILGPSFWGFDYEGNNYQYYKIKCPSYLTGVEVTRAVNASDLNYYNYSGPDEVEDPGDEYNQYYGAVYKKKYKSAQPETSDPEKSEYDFKNCTISTIKSFDADFGYTYTFFAALRETQSYNNLSAYTQLGALGLTNSLASCITFDDTKVVLKLKFEDFFGTGKIFSSTRTGAYAYKKTLNKICVCLVKEPVEDVNIAIKNMSKRSKDAKANLSAYVEVSNSTTEDGLDKDCYGNKIGGTTYLSQKSESTNSNAVYIDNDPSMGGGASGEETKYLSVQLNLDMTFHAIAMPGFVFKGISFDKTSQTPISFGSRTPTLIELIRAALQNNGEIDDIDYSVLKNTNIYAYYDIAKYEIQIIGQVDGINKDTILSSNEKYFENSFIGINPADLELWVQGQDVEFLGIYLLDGNDEKLLTLDKTYNYVNYNPNIIVTNKVYTALINNVVVDPNKTEDFLNYASFEIQDVHEKYIHLKRGGNDYYIEANPTSYLRILLKFATRETPKMAPTQTNNIIEISDAYDLVWLSNQVNGGTTFENYIIKQTANIDFEDVSNIYYSKNSITNAYTSIIDGYYSKNSITNAYTSIIDGYYSKNSITKAYTSLTDDEVNSSTYVSVSIPAYTEIELLKETDNYYHIKYSGYEYYIKTPNYGSEGNILYNGGVINPSTYVSVSIPAYTEIELLGETDNYYHIRYSGNEYYIKTPNYGSEGNILYNGGVNPSTYVSVSIPANTRLELLKETDNYYHIRYSGNEYYIKTQSYDAQGYILFKYLPKYMDPIGTSAHPFKGTYDGQSFVIKNLKLTNGDVAIGEDVGLFGYTDGATIKNLTLIGGSATGFNNVGAVVGSAVDTAFENVTNNGCHVKAITYAYYDIYGDEIKNCSTDTKNYNIPADIYSFEKIDEEYKSLITYYDDRAYGGFAGAAGDCTFVGCGVRADITDTKLANVDTTVVRGMIGYALFGVDETRSTPIKECYYIGNLTLNNYDIIDSFAHYVPDSEEPLQVELIENCFYEMGSTRYYIIDSSEYGEKVDIQSDKFSSDIWVQIGSDYGLKTFYWA